MGSGSSTRPIGQRIERFEAPGVSFRLTLPVSSEALIDEAEFDADERLPYWAELWPSARALTHHLLESPQLPARVMELGCGVGLPSLALLHRGVNVLATDYYAAALTYARDNAAANGLPPLATRLLDWREPAITPRFPLAIAADVMYEARNADVFLHLLPRILEPGGSLLLADPGRIHLKRFFEGVEAAGWVQERIGTRTEDAPAGGGRQVEVSIYRIALPGNDQRLARERAQRPAPKL